MLRPSAKQETFSLNNHTTCPQGLLTSYVSPAGVLDRRVQTDGGDRSAPLVGSADDDTVPIGDLPPTDPRRFK